MSFAGTTSRCSRSDRVECTERQISLNITVITIRRVDWPSSSSKQVECVYIFICPSPVWFDIETSNSLQSTINQQCLSFFDKQRVICSRLTKSNLPGWSKPLHYLVPATFGRIMRRPVLIIRQIDCLPKTSLSQCDKYLTEMTSWARTQE